MDLRTVRDRLVRAALPHVAFDGWSRAALAAAAAAEGLGPTLPARLFPHGGADAVAHFVALADREMAEELAARDLSSLRLTARVALAIETRLRRWGDQREAVRRALVLLGLPHHLPLAARLAWGTADAIWVAVGERSHDFSWYTKRSSLAAVYTATLLCWLDDDETAWGEETAAFLRRRLDEAGRVTRTRTRMVSALSRLSGGGLGAAARRFGLTPSAGSR
jgi:ubiquinone biosynthesis protein COQ9